MDLLKLWIRTGFDPDSFWQQSPETFRAIMDGVAERMKAEAEGQLSQAWNIAAFMAASQAKGGLKPLRHYMRAEPRKMTNTEMLANMRILAQRANRAASR